MKQNKKNGIPRKEEGIILKRIQEELGNIVSSHKRIAKNSEILIQYAHQNPRDEGNLISNRAVITTKKTATLGVPGAEAVGADGKGR